MKMLGDPFKLFSISKVGPKGQVVIPAEARTEMNINPSDSVVVMGFPHKKAIIIVNEKTFQKHMKYMRRHFDLLGKYENLKSQEAQFDD